MVVMLQHEFNQAAGPPLRLQFMGASTVRQPDVSDIWFRRVSALSGFRAAMHTRPVL